MLQMGKESRDNAQSLTVFNADIKTMQEEGFIIIFNEQYLNIKVNIVADTFDRKASNIYQGLGGAYCDLCDLSKERCEDICTIEQGFVINRDIETMEQIFLDLVQEDGSLTQKSKDYDVRHGQTASPIAGSNVRSVQVLHALLRGFDHFMKVVVHLSAGVYAWTESKTASTTHFLEIEKKNIQELIGKKTGIKWDFSDSSGQGGSTTTGNVARNLLYNEKNRKLITDYISNKHARMLAERYGFLLSNIIRAMSSSQKINIKKYRDICKETNILLRQEMPWVSLTPTIHKLLGHTWELIELNNDTGLKSWSEEGMEANNKQLRIFREKLSRKTNQLQNLEDCFKRLWVTL
jgi:hypothetical protein